MIDDKKIEKAARQISEKVVDANGFDDSKPTHLAFLDGHVDGFNAGAKWAINEFLKDLWHSSSEEPKAIPHDEYGFVHTEDVVQLIVVTRNDETKFMYSTHQEEYDGDKEGYWLLYDEDANEYDPSEGDIKKWAYLDNLFPKKGDNQ